VTYSGVPFPNSPTNADLAARITAFPDQTNFAFGLANIKNGSTSQINVHAVNADSAEIIDPAHATSNVTITKVIIIDGTTAVQYSFTADGTQSGRAVDLFQADGSVNITGLKENDRVEIFTTNGFDRVEIHNTSGNDNSVTGSDFKLSSPGILTTATGDPLNLTFPLTLKDFDGDTATGSINITLNPTGTLTGTAGAESLIGSDTGDTLIGAGGNDILTGGAGDDHFRFNATTDGLDLIKDFVAGSDVIDFANAAFGNLGVGTLSAANFASNPTGTTTSAAGTPQFVFNTSTSVLSYDADGAGGNAAIAMAKLENVVALSNTSIHIV